MRKAWYLLAAVVVIGASAASSARQVQSPVSAGTSVAQAESPAPTVANIEMPALTPEEQQQLARRFSPERLAAIRERLQADAQRAVRDQAEQAFREPTAAEAAALAGPRTESTAATVALPGGGVALKADATNVEFVKATVGKDGVVVTHEGKGGRRDQ